ncbi:hypothetical protein RUND412_011525, partial [Rhizina undulata]
MSQALAILLRFGSDPPSSECWPGLNTAAETVAPVPLPLLKKLLDCGLVGVASSGTLFEFIVKADTGGVRNIKGDDEL